MRAAGMRPAVAIASAILALAGAEIALRWVAPVRYRQPPDPARASAWRNLVHRRSEIPGLTYELVPGVVSERRGIAVRINSIGMRDDEPRPKEEFDRRILLLGDSVTFGFGVSVEESFAHCLERRSNGHVDVLNGGVGGYSTVDEAAWLSARGAGLDPDLVVLVYSLNDAEIRPIQPLHSNFAAVSWWQHSHLLRLAAQAWVASQEQRYGDGNYYRALYRNPRSWEITAEGLRKIAATARGMGDPVLLVQIPLLPDGAWSAGRYAYEGEHAQVAAVAAEAGMAVLDLAPVFAGEPKGELRVSAEDDHPNARGHALICSAIDARLRAGL